MFPIDNTMVRSQLQDSILDANSLEGVKAMGRDKDPQALKEIAKQFEAIFVQQMLKQMRSANEVFGEDSYFNSNEMRFHQDLFDQQMSLEMTSGRGIGLADALYDQMLRAYGAHVGAPGEKPGVRAELHMSDRRASVQPSGQRAPSVTTADVSSGGKTAVAQSPAEFVAYLKPHAEQAAAELNVNADVLLAQAALETGWGRHVIHTREGDNSFNLFNIKADARWDGERVNVTTLEYRNGVAQQERANFRRYEDYAQSFSDYVNFLQTNPRYQQALAVGDDSAAYAEELQRAGYATDPEYAQKIKRLLDSDPIRAAAENLVAVARNHNEA